MIHPNTYFAYLLILGKTYDTVNKIKINLILPLWKICPVVLASLCYLWPGAGARVCCKMSPTLVVGFSDFPPMVPWPSWFQNISSSNCHVLHVKGKEKSRSSI